MVHIEIISDDVEQENRLAEAEAHRMLEKKAKERDTAKVEVLKNAENVPKVVLEPSARILEQKPSTKEPKEVGISVDEKKADGGKSWSKGFLNETKDSLYGPEGSEQGKVSTEQKKKWAEKELNDNMNKKMGFSKEDSEYSKPTWYTSEWPKGCQYNSPECHMDPLAETTHSSEFHKQVARNNERWKSVLEGNIEPACRLSFIGINDEDLEDLIPAIRNSDVLVELDLSYNKISDKGVQSLVGTMTNGGFKTLKELRIHHNEFTNLGTMMLSQGLKILRKDLIVHLEDPLHKYKKEDSGAEKKNEEEKTD